MTSVPMQFGMYAAPVTDTFDSECDCYVRVGCGVESTSHSVACAVSGSAALEIEEQLEFGTSLQAFAPEFDAHSLGLHSEGFSRRAIRDRLTAAHLEEQRTANLIALANGTGFPLEVRELAKDTVMRRLAIAAKVADGRSRDDETD